MRTWFRYLRKLHGPRVEIHISDGTGASVHDRLLAPTASIDHEDSLRNSSPWNRKNREIPVEICGQDDNNTQLSAQTYSMTQVAWNYNFVSRYRTMLRLAEVDPSSTELAVALDIPPAGLVACVPCCFACLRCQSAQKEKKEASCYLGKSPS